MPLPDVNVWLALTFAAGTFITVPLNFGLTVLSGEISCFCRSTQMGFLRLATNATDFGPDALTLSEAWQAYDTLQSDALVSFSGEPPGIEPIWRHYTERRMFSPKVWNDAYLAAFAEAANLEIVTFDHGISQYQNVRSKILS